MKSKLVVVKMEVYAAVNLPDDKERASVVCEDPAIEAAMQALPGRIEVYLWGEDEEPAIVLLEVDEQDCEVEDDDR